MLVVLHIVQVTTVLLHLVDTKFLRVDRLGSHGVGLEMAVDLSLLLALGVLDPGLLDVLALQDVLPLGVGSPAMRLWHRQEVRLVHRLREHQAHLVPEILDLRREGVEGALEVLQRLRPSFHKLLRKLQHLLGDDGGGCSSRKERSGGELHDGRAAATYREGLIGDVVGWVEIPERHCTGMSGSGR